ncbi:homoserine kinase [Planococcus sp. N028]|uniref:Homoserine kinase n=1 Tax=Planococcus shixiaomingii TaxID=3058393 RepID=A0ABT8N0X0_9BACL|nr:MULTISPECIES: homoserine kinase [unclassified Planococcus (in: firmicutes)]MDN7241543.1 homoserine kinase [Planococcus sp. N028]WKA53792.1 homoserine kinase [Planococcus sp. N022]
MSWKEFSVTVPASTANLGPGFDSIGLALDLHLTVDVLKADEWSIDYKQKDYQELSSVSDNLILATAKAVAKQAGRELPAAKLHVDTDIPLGRGLGSSASAIAAGIEIADRLLNLDLPMQEKMKIGSKMEGHPDNITASFLGGLTISYLYEDELELVHVPKVEIGVIILVPPEQFLTADARNLLPQTMDYPVGVRGSAAGNVLSAALVNGDWAKAGIMMERDTFHEPFRKNNFVDFDKIQKMCRENGAYGSAISGAGPSLFIAVPAGQEEQLGANLRSRFPHYECLVTRPCSLGVKINETVS